jgi:hypothetical protein
VVRVLGTAVCAASPAIPSRRATTGKPRPCEGGTRSTGPGGSLVRFRQSCRSRGPPCSASSTLRYVCSV